MLRVRFGNIEVEGSPKECLEFVRLYGSLSRESVSGTETTESSTAQSEFSLMKQEPESRSLVTRHRETTYPLT